LHTVRPSIHLPVLPVPADRFSQDRKDVETSNLVETQRWTKVTTGANAKVKVIENE